MFQVNDGYMNKTKTKMMSCLRRFCDKSIGGRKSSTPSWLGRYDFAIILCVCRFSPFHRQPISDPPTHDKMQYSLSIRDTDWVRFTEFMIVQPIDSGVRNFLSHFLPFSSVLFVIILNHMFIESLLWSCDAISRLDRKKIYATISAKKQQIFIRS